MCKDSVELFAHFGGMLTLKKFNTSSRGSSIMIDYSTRYAKSLVEEYYRFYEQEYFSNVQRIGTGGFGKVYRANWKNSDQYLALKSFFDLDDVTAKEIVHELKLQRDIQFHNNIIKFYGVAQFDPENQNVQSKKLFVSDGVC
ncbi:unnamed protein product [Rhizophagus irregularis]|nr:unnamed protein product [Rhizophagus irregularis]